MARLRSWQKEYSRDAPKKRLQYNSNDRFFNKILTAWKLQTSTTIVYKNRLLKLPPSGAGHLLPEAGGKWQPDRIKKQVPATGDHHGVPLIEDCDDRFAERIHVGFGHPRNIHATGGDNIDRILFPKLGDLRWGQP